MKRPKESKKLIGRNKFCAINIKLTSNFLGNEHFLAAHRAHIDELLEQLADDECTDLENDDVEDLHYCVVCDKTFKTMNAQINHENSKQHRKQLAELKRHMKAEDHALFEKIGCNAESSSRKGVCKSERANRKVEKKKSSKEDCDQDLVDIEKRRIEAQCSDDLDVLDNLNKKLTDFSMMDADDRRVEKTMISATEKGIEKKKKKGNKKNTDVRNVVSSASGGNAPKIAVCDKCKEIFESRTKLFEHLKLTGHATIKASSVPQPSHKNRKDGRK
ncbi:zinc finger, C2H2 type [Dictyocaulus viviparus]|uniref:Zinc finger, C2H2 type n=1 Tax=Dictyocaulus viviparus TaxID=29172 RepID=A0A0D8Y4Y6_DICVI|nr:zinc finger, C2H2 type [Dictyocaulus viviparus]